MGVGCALLWAVNMETQNKEIMDRLLDKFGAAGCECGYNYSGRS